MGKKRIKIVGVEAVPGTRECPRVRFSEGANHLTCKESDLGVDCGIVHKTFHVCPVLSSSLRISSLRVANTSTRKIRKVVCVKWLTLYLIA
ncbi:hypothetical protein M0804_002172 [Polistes exclamans]|nr:hypothetical protein M0804_002172 [Polistes exclamans]